MVIAGEVDMPVAWEVSPAGAARLVDDDDMARVAKMSDELVEIFMTVTAKK